MERVPRVVARETERRWCSLQSSLKLQLIADTLLNDLFMGGESIWLFILLKGDWHPSISRALPSTAISQPYHPIVPIVIILSSCSRWQWCSKEHVVDVRMYSTKVGV